MSACVKSSRSRREGAGTFTAGVADCAAVDILQMSRKAFLNACSFVTGNFSDFFGSESLGLKKNFQLLPNRTLPTIATQGPVYKSKNVLITNRRLPHESAVRAWRVPIQCAQLIRNLSLFFFTGSRQAYPIGVFVVIKQRKSPPRRFADPAPNDAHRRSLTSRNCWSNQCDLRVCKSKHKFFLATAQPGNRHE